jgi:hypothetical protein
MPIPVDNHLETIVPTDAECRSLPAIRRAKGRWRDIAPMREVLKRPLASMLAGSFGARNWCC